MSKHYIDITTHDGDRVVRTLGSYESDRLAERADRGVNRNLDHENYYTQIREEEA